VFSPLFVLFLALLVDNLWRPGTDRNLGMMYGVCGMVGVAPLISATHWTASWTNDSETLRRAVPVHWGTCVLSLGLAAGVTATVLLAFPSQAPSRATAATSDRVTADIEKEFEVALNRDQFRAVLAKDFPRDLTATVTVGPQWVPGDVLSYATLSASGADGRIESVSAGIPFGTRPGEQISTGWCRTRRGKDTFALQLSRFTRGDYLLLTDLDADGEWDVQSRRSGKTLQRLIRVEKDWVVVDKTLDLMDERPRAIKDGGTFEFLDRWTRVTSEKPVVR
jgi:hypothetical protein